VEGSEQPTAIARAAAPSHRGRVAGTRYIGVVAPGRHRPSTGPPTVGRRPIIQATIVQENGRRRKVPRRDLAIAPVSAGHSRLAGETNPTFASRPPGTGAGSTGQTKPTACRRRRRDETNPIAPTGRRHPGEMDPIRGSIRAHGEERTHRRLGDGPGGSSPRSIGAIVPGENEPKVGSGRTVPRVMTWLPSRRSLEGGFTVSIRVIGSRDASSHGGSIGPSGQVGLDPVVEAARWPIGMQDGMIFSTAREVRVRANPDRHSPGALISFTLSGFGPPLNRVSAGISSDQPGFGVGGEDGRGVSGFARMREFVRLPRARRPDCPGPRDRVGPGGRERGRWGESRR